MIFEFRNIQPRYQSTWHPRAGRRKSSSDGASDQSSEEDDSTAFAVPRQPSPNNGGRGGNRRKRSHLAAACDVRHAAPATTGNPHAAVGSDASAPQPASATWSGSVRLLDGALPGPELCSITMQVRGRSSHNPPPSL